MKLHEYRQRHPYASFIFVVVVALFVTSLQGVQIQKNHDTINQLRAVQREQAAARQETRERFAAADLALCSEIEKLNKQRRDDALRTYKNLDQTLRVLKLKRTPEITAIALANRDQALKRFAPRKGGCASLPSNREG